jgi:hypothetical protein
MKQPSDSARALWASCKFRYQAVGRDFSFWDVSMSLITFFEKSVRLSWGMEIYINGVLEFE